MRGVRLSFVLAGLVALHAVLSYPDGYNSHDAMTTGGLVAAACVVRWLGGIRDMAGAVEWGRSTARRNKLIALLFVGMSCLAAWTSVAAGSPGSAVARLIEIWVILPAFLVAGEWMQKKAAQMWSGRRQARGSDDTDLSAELQRRAHWAHRIQTSHLLGLLILIYGALTGLVEGISPETFYILLPCAYAIRVAAGRTLADVLHARGWRKGLALKWLFTTVFAFVGPGLLLSQNPTMQWTYAYYFCVVVFASMFFATGVTAYQWLSYKVSSTLWGIPPAE